MSPLFNHCRGAYSTFELSLVYAIMVKCISTRCQMQKHIYRLMGLPFIFSRPFIPDVKQQVSPYVHRGMRATVQQVTTAHLCHL